MKQSQNISILPEDGIFFISLLLVNIRASLFFPLFPETTLFPPGLAWLEILFWVLLTIAANRTMSRNKSLRNYFETWQNNKLIFAFILLAGISLAWSILFWASLFRWMELFLATAIAFYFVTKYNLKRFVELLSWGSAILVMTSIFIIILQPNIGISFGFPYYGAWRGIFWHRNQFGNLMSLLNMFYLFSSAQLFSKDRPQALFWGFFYLLTLVLVGFSKSATAIIVTSVINGLFTLLLIWLRIRHALTKTHYYLTGVIVTITSILIYINLDFLLGLLGRSSNLTGRTGLWIYLLENMVVKRPWFGYGFGAIWNIEDFRVLSSKILGWPFPILIGDNGYIDILLHLGIVGLSIFLAILVLAYMRAIQFAVKKTDLFSFIPVFFLIYATLANISFSLFMETEMFIWTILIFVIAGKYEETER